MMGFFQDRGSDAYAKAAEAVKAGHASKEQKELNKTAATRSGSIGDTARDAYK